MITDEKKVYILSGEGDDGTWDAYTGDDLAGELELERCGGDRWARAYEVIEESEEYYMLSEIDGDDYRCVPIDILD